MKFLLNFYGGSVICLWDFYWIPVGLPWYFYDTSLGLLLGLLDFYGMSMAYLWGFKRMPMEFPLDSYVISMMFL